MCRDGRLPTINGMQRLFSMFPMGAPGVALLLLRVGLSALLLDGTIGFMWAIEPTWLLVLPLITATALCLGVLAPLFAMAAIAMELIAWLGLGMPLGVVQLCAVLDAIALALLGPGGYSIDAIVFGRRRIVLLPDPPHGEDR